MTADIVLGVEAEQVFRQMRRHLPPSLAMAAKLAGRGAVEVAADGVWISLSDGRRLLDFGSYAVALIGHRHPLVLQAVRAQLDVQPTATRSLGNPTLSSAAARLSGYFDDALPRVYFGLNGTDAVEAATKLARLGTGRPRIIAVEGGYHGKSLGALALTHSEQFRHGSAQALSAVSHIRPDDPGAVAKEAAAGDVAAVVFEPIQGEHGIRPIDAQVLAQWCTDARRHGAMVIADEIQTGLRRCGPRSVALDAGLPIDALLVGKALGGGVVPLSAMLCTDDFYRPLAENPFLHTATFAGHPLCVAAVEATLSALEELSESGIRIGRQLEQGLREIQATRPGLVTEVRGRGLLWGIDFVSAQVAGEVMVNLLQRGLLISPCLSRPTTLRLLPSLITTPTQVVLALDLLASAIAEAAAAVGQGLPG
ncbi:aminotransferase [Rhizocola hellebori]|uniref:Aminotransferase n=1 Tax=Rhizocola hellebori TaxID=1392758 RepID=A0A8J3Q7P5_9ACTN|nr:aspartate aminotransferase family protein [Rhizocola hellebori]GIH04907.1 aminotransferase [Rhizocola hellebori]